MHDQGGPVGGCAAASLKPVQRWPRRQLPGEETERQIDCTINGFRDNRRQKTIGKTKCECEKVRFAWLGLKVCPSASAAFGVTVLGRCCLFWWSAFLQDFVDYDPWISKLYLVQQCSYHEFCLVDHLTPFSKLMLIFDRRLLYLDYNQCYVKGGNCVNSLISRGQKI